MADTTNSGSSDRGADATRTVPRLPKRTPWFTSPQKPARVGLYETRYPGGPNVMRLWDGYRWRYQEGGLALLFGVRGDQWRGLASDPSKINRR